MRQLRKDGTGIRDVEREPARVSVRHYLWAVDGPLRIPEKLHQGLITRRLALPDCAGTTQKILEVFAVPMKRGAIRLHGRGNIYHFDEQGFVDLSPYAEAIDAVKALQFRDQLNEKLIDLRPAMHQRHFSRANFWKPTRLMLDRVRGDFQPRSGSVNASKIRVLTSRAGFATSDMFDPGKRRSGQRNRRSPR
jgi:hypothetical protein